MTAHLQTEQTTGAQAPVVAISGLAKSFGTRRIIERLDLAIPQGESLALIGANGTGKSTLLRMIVRLAEADAGTILVLGDEVGSLRGAALKRFRARVGVVFQKHNLVSRLSALSNVVHGVQSRRSGPRTWAQALAPAEIRDEAMECLAAVGLADKAMQRADSLSGGQSQRVAIARMLMQRPQIVLADEPDASLDPRAGREVMELLFRLTRDKGLTLVFVSHHMAHARRFSDRIVGLGNGGIALDRRALHCNEAELAAFFEEPAEDVPAAQPALVFA
ncbi:ATP-binding cassette domain-containing protein [Bosea sp. (in: a-proteobacteria)]|uniref:phosphonate ABC transporter ATP-binding protein n=1 Tax=Bosea sp. (in: a-proteobacteria) TaxID=1871050 RepID=UPI001AC906B2|nr:ATP-binding cassette domain-containing protein [Bosea sp. (in: a-proteobacteria)]MBN9436296.1 ATP-binding cassette domain-containing protein [Bosea sp. (in: a-proteobacteria)]